MLACQNLSIKNALFSHIFMKIIFFLLKKPNNCIFDKLIGISMKINWYDESNGKINIIEPIGAIDSTNAPILDEYINAILDKNKLNMVLDLSYVNYISSAGIGLIIYLHKKIAQLKGILIISGINAEISDIFSILGFYKLFVIIQNRNLAVRKIEEALNSPESFNSDFKEQNNANAFNIDSRELVEEPVPSIPKMYDNGYTENLVLFKEDHKGTEIVEKSIAFNAFILECPNCKDMMQVTHIGQNSCSNCYKVFTVNEDQTVYF